LIVPTRLWWLRLHLRPAQAIRMGAKLARIALAGKAFGGWVALNNPPSRTGEVAAVAGRRARIMPDIDDNSGCHRFPAKGKVSFIINHLHRGQSGNPKPGQRPVPSQDDTIWPAKALALVTPRKVIRVLSDSVITVFPPDATALCWAATAAPAP
jgi:hypothetical protein